MAPCAAAGAPAGPYVYLIGLALIAASLPFTRPELVPLRPIDESPLAVLDFEFAFPDMRGLTRFAERQPRDADSPLIAQYLAGEPLQKAAIIAGAGEILDQSATALSARARVLASTAVTMRFYTYYFAGWRATVDGVPVEIRPEGPNGLIALDVPSGEHEVVLRFGATPPRVAGAIMSGVGLLGVGLLLALGRRKPAVVRA